ncbi:MAG: putative transcriptional regulator of viral defense system [Chlamydiales bacterium]|jgi:predicted transcriptional regulator of viral defense system
MFFQSFFTNRQIFTTEEVRNIISSNKDKSTLKNLMTYHLNKGHIIRIRRALYYVVPKGITPESSPVDPYLICSKMASDALLGYHTALAYFGKLHSIRNDFIYITQQKVKSPFSFREETYQGVSLPKKLQQSKVMDLGVQTCHHLSHQIRVTSLERTFIDVLDRPALVGDWEEIWRSLESIEYLDLDQVLTYALSLGNATTIAKAGFFLEMHQENLMIPDQFLKKLSTHCPLKPHYLDRHTNEPQKLMKRWKLIVPQHLLQRNWEEPHENI